MAAPLEEVNTFPSKFFENSHSFGAFKLWYLKLKTLSSILYKLCVDFKTSRWLKLRSIFKPGSS